MVGVRGRGAAPCPIPAVAVGLMCIYTGRAAYMLGLCLQGRFSTQMGGRKEIWDSYPPAPRTLPHRPPPAVQASSSEIFLRLSDASQ